MSWTGAILASLALCVTTLLPGFVLVSLAHAQTTGLQLEVIPQALELAPDGEVRADVVACNTGEETLRNVRISWFSGSSVAIRVEGGPLDTLPPRGEYAWTLLVSSIDDEPVSDTIHLRVDYAWQPAGANEPVSRMAATSLKVTSHEQAPTDSLVTLQLKTTLQSLTQQRPGLVYLVLSNNSVRNITLDEIVASAPDFIGLETGNVTGTILGPRDVRVFPVLVTANETVQPGKHLLLFQATIEWEERGRVATAKLVQTQEIEVGVFGESAVLQVLGIPSFLLVPGFLLLVIMGLLWDIGKAKEAEGFPLKAPKPEFWAVAITLSILMAFLYPLVTRWVLGVPRNYFESYGIADVSTIWVASVVLGVVFYVFGKAGVSLPKRYRAWQEGRLTPSIDDGPIDIMTKLHRQHRGPGGVEMVEIAVEGVQVKAFLIEPRKEGRDEYWVAPAIKLDWLPDAPETLRRAVQDRRNEGDMGTLAELLRVEMGRRVQVGWEATLGLPKQTKKKISRFLPQREAIVRE